MNNIRKIKLLFSLVYKISPTYLFLVVLGSLFTSMQIFGNVIIPKYLIEELIGEQSIPKLLLYGGGIVVFNFIFGFINKTYTRILSVKNNYVSKKLMQEMSKKIMEIEYKNLEDPYYLDLKERAVFACNNQSAHIVLIRNLSSIISSSITLIGLVAIMFTLSYILVVILLSASLITILISALFKKYQNKFFQGIIPLNRRYGYYLGLSFENKLAKDIRLNDMSPMINKSVMKFNKSVNDEFKVFYRFQGLVIGLQKVLTIIQSGIVYLYVSLRVFTSKYGSKISLGDFTMYVTSAINFSQTFDKLFYDMFNFFLMLNYLDPFMEFMLLNEEKKIKARNILEEIKTIRFDNISFKYPKCDNYVLKDISFQINKGEKISIVGLNGAGKTTLVKLLSRLYQPTNGAIYINDINIFDYDYESYIKQISAVFQDYKLFAYSIYENITGNNNKVDISEIIKQVGLEEKVNELPNGLETLLNKNFDEDGIELSGGQAQKVAIARALYKKSSLVILDEPTSALDPLAEAEIYQHFNDLVTDKTAIYISHRMSSSVFCDKVLILDSGSVSDFDNHKNLMKKKNSLYYKLFDSQAKNYKLD